MRSMSNRTRIIVGVVIVLAVAAAVVFTRFYDSEKGELDIAGGFWGANWEGECEWQGRRCDGEEKEEYTESYEEECQSEGCSTHEFNEYICSGGGCYGGDLTELQVEFYAYDTFNVLHYGIRNTGAMVSQDVACNNDRRLQAGQSVRIKHPASESHPCAWRIGK